MDVIESETITHGCHCFALIKAAGDGIGETDDLLVLSPGCCSSAGDRVQFPSLEGQRC